MGVNLKIFLLKHITIKYVRQFQFAIFILKFEKIIKNNGKLIAWSFRLWMNNDFCKLKSRAKAHQSSITILYTQHMRHACHTTV